MEKLKVLVVDTDVEIRMGIKYILKNFNVDFPFMQEPYYFDVIEASTGHEAIQQIDKHIPDIVLLDSALEGIDGIEVLKYLKKKNIGSKEVMITSDSSLDLAVEATRHGANDFLTKPFTPLELQNSMTTIAKNLFLQRVTKKMTEAGKEVRFQFLSVLSHELKAPINALLGYLDMMKQRSFGENMQDYEHILDRSVTRVKGMRHLIMDLLDMTRIEFNEKKRNLININLLDVINNSIDMLYPFAIQKDVKIILHTQDPVFIKADSSEMSMIFNNLISNAVKYNKDGGQVEVWVSKHAELVEIKVADSGIGMEEEDVAKLFNEFVRIKNSKTKNINGSGLGLSILKKITNLYDGDIYVESKPDVGTTFEVKLQDYSSKVTQ